MEGYPNTQQSGYDWQSMLDQLGGGGGGQQQKKPGGGGGFNMDYMQMIAMIGDYASKNNAATGYAAGGAGPEGGNIYAEGAQKAQDFGDPVGAGILGYFAGKKAKKQKKRLKKKIEAARRATEAIGLKGLSQQEAFARQATQQRLGGFETAKRAAQQSASGAKRSALEREQQLAGRLSQGLTNQGLGGTSVGANLNRGVAAGTSRELSNIDEQLGQYFGQLAMGRAGIEAGGTEALSDIANERTGFQSAMANYYTPYLWQRLGAHDQRMAGGIRSTGSSIPMQMFGGGGNFGGK